MTSAADLITALTGRTLTVATAESLTGGGVCAALTSVPGASAVVRGAVVAYSADAKTDVLEVPSDVIARHGTVAPEVAEAMAAGVCRVLGSEMGLATTGVAGPDPLEGHPVGTVVIAVALGGRVETRTLLLHGSREEIRGLTVQAVLGLALQVLAG